jgi:diguanylate cyclase (GGDEF)-like protein/PAS domain S-box-containing protein
MAPDGTLSVEDRQTVLDAVLAKHPDALITAIDRNGLFVPMPKSVPVTTHRVITGRSSALQLVAPDDRVVVIDAWTTATEKGASNALVHPLADPDHTVRLHFIDVRAQHGVFVGLLTDFAGLAGFGQRVDLGEIAPKSSTVRKDAVAVITSIDAAAPKMLGWTEAELVGRRTLELLHPDDHQRAIESWMDMLSAPGGTRRVRLRHQHRKGHFLWLEITNHNLLNDPEQNCVVAEMVDISDEMAAQEALRANEQLLRRLTETLPLGVLQIDADRRVIYQNERAVEIFGLGLDETLDAGPVADADRPALRAALDDALADGRDADLECGYALDRLCSVSVRPLTAPSGEVTGAVLCVTDVTEAARLRAELTHHATYDALTGCLNRVSIMAALRGFLTDPGDSRGLAAIFIDLNNFKEINDTLGHAAGDDLLTYVAAALRDAIRGTDLLGRLGGDEFLIVARDVAGQAEAGRLGEHLTAHLATYGTELAGRRVNVQASIGVAWTGPAPAALAAGPDVTAAAPDVAAAAEAAADALIARADEAMYQAKRQRSGRLGLVVSRSQTAA